MLIGPGHKEINVNTYRSSKILGNKATRRLFLFGFVFLTFVGLMVTGINIYKEMQPIYEVNELGGAYIHANSSNLKLPKEIPDSLVPIIDQTKITKYRINTEQSGEIVDIDIVLESKNDPERSFNKYIAILGDGFEYSNDFNYEIEGIYHDMDMEIKIIKNKKEKYEIFIDMKKR